MEKKCRDCFFINGCLPERLHINNEMAGCGKKGIIITTDSEICGHFRPRSKK